MSKYFKVGYTEYGYVLVMFTQKLLFSWCIWFMYRLCVGLLRLSVGDMLHEEVWMVQKYYWIRLQSLDQSKCQRSNTIIPQKQLNRLSLSPLLNLRLQVFFVKYNKSARRMHTKIILVCLWFVNMFISIIILFLGHRRPQIVVTRFWS